MDIRSKIVSLFNPSHKVDSLFYSNNIFVALERINQDVERWRMAVRQAESTVNPSRKELIRTYNDIMIDSHLHSVIEQRKNKVLAKKYSVVDSQGNINQRLTEILQSEWFYKYQSYFLDSIFYGFSLVEFGNLTNTKFDKIELIPRHFVVPEMNAVSETGYALGSAIDFTKEPYSEWGLFLGDKKDLGLLLKASPLVLFKKMDLQFWMAYIQIFGQPLRKGSWDGRDLEVKNQLVNALKNMGSSAYALIPDGANIEFVSDGGKNDSWQLYDKLIERLNSEISKLIVGQTGTTDTKSFVGSAKVHEQVAEDYSKFDSEKFQYNVNGVLIPFLEKKGISFKGHKFTFIDDNYEERVKQAAYWQMVSTSIGTLANAGLMTDAEWLTKETSIPLIFNAELQNSNAIAFGEKKKFILRLNGY